MIKSVITRAASVFIILCLLTAPVLALPFNERAAGKPMLYAVPFTENTGTFPTVKDESTGLLVRKADERFDTRFDVTSHAWKISSADENTVITKLGDTLNLISSDTVSVDIMFSDRPITPGNTEFSTVVSAISGTRYTTVSLTLITDNGRFTASAEVQSGKEFLIAMDLRFLPQNTKIMGLSFEADATSLTIRDAFFDIRGAAKFAERYLTGGFSAATGSVSVEGASAAIIADENGIADILSDVMIKKTEGRRYLAVTLTVPAENCFMSLYIPEGDGRTEVSSSELSVGTHTYYLSVPSDSMSRYGIELISNLPLVNYSIVSISLAEFPSESYFVTKSVGKTDSVKLTDGTLSVSGTLTSAAVVEYIDAMIALYEMPLSAAFYDVSDMTPIATIDISTAFEFTLTHEDYYLSPTESKYAAAILTETGPVFIGEPRCASFGASNTTTAGSVIGLTHASSAGVFEANAAHAVIDIDLAKLSGGLTPNATGKLCTYGGKYYYLDSDMISALDEEIRFYVSAGVQVYFRLICTEDLSSLGYTYPSNNVLNTQSDNGRSFVSAVVGYLADRYPAVSDYICGDAMNAVPADSIAEYRDICSENIRLIYNTVASKRGTPTVYIPLASDGNADAVFLYSRIVAALESNGYADCGIYWHMDTNIYEAMADIGHVILMLDTYSITRVPKIAACWTPSASSSVDKLLADFTELAVHFTDRGYDALILNVPENTEDIYGKINNILNIEDSTRYTYHGSAFESTDEYKGSYALWDFSDSFNSLGWMNGGGCSSVSTQMHGYSGISSRYLDAVIPARDGGANGVIICMTDSPMSLDRADYITLSLYIESSADTCQLKFTLGSGDRRAEFLIDAEANKPVTLVCDISSMPKGYTFDYAAVITKADSDIKVSIANISVASDSMTNEELRDEFAKPETEAEAPKKTSEMLWVTLIVTVIGTVIIFAALTYKKKA